MSQYQANTPIDNYKNFIERVVQNKEVWAIQNPSTGEMFLQPSETGIAPWFVPIWSSKENANRFFKDDVIDDGFKIVSFDILQFINHIIYTFFHYNMVVVADWNRAIPILEKPPLEIADEIFKEIQHQTQFISNELQNISECQSLIYRLCESLSFHAVETDMTASHISDPSAKFYLEMESLKAKVLIALSGYNIDELYPAEKRP